MAGPAACILSAALIALACAGGTAAGPASSAPPPAEIAPGVPRAASAEPTEPKYAGSQVLVAWQGAERAAPTVTRSRDEALALAAEVWRRAKAGESFEALAQERSDAPSAGRGGALGTWRTGTMVPEFERAVAALQVGEVSPPFETPYGWHVVRREALREIGARHILVSWKGAWRSGATRTREAARARIDEALAKLAAGEDFAAVARTFSEDPTASVGGDLGPIAPGQLIPAFEDAAFALSVGERSAVVETPYGFHVIERTR